MKYRKIQRKIRGRCKTIILFKTGVDYLYQYQNLLQYSKENKKMPIDNIKVEYDAYWNVWVIYSGKLKSIRYKMYSSGLPYMKGRGNMSGMQAYYMV